MNKHKITNKYFINCSLKEDVDSPEIRVWDRELNILPPIDIVKLKNGSNNCWVKARNADVFYLRRFLPHIQYKGEYSIFSDAISSLSESTNYNKQIPILFISGYYRRMLGLSNIKCEIKTEQDLDNNIRKIEIYIPTNKLYYLWYLLMASLTHPQLSMRFRGLISILALIFTLVNLYFKTETLIFIASLIIFISSLRFEFLDKRLRFVLLFLSILVLCMNNTLISFLPNISDCSLISLFKNFIYN